MGAQGRPTKKQLVALYAAAARFREAEPWRWLYDADLICVENPSDKALGYCSVMGRMGQHFGLCVFLGARGLAGFFALMELDEGEDSFTDVAFAQDYLMCSFVDQGDLDERDLEEIGGLGLAFTGRRAYPQFRRFEPGYQPWNLNQAEAEFLTHALEQVLEVFSQYHRGEVELDFGSARTVLRASKDRNGRLEWETRPMRLRRPEIQYERVEVENELLLWQLRKTPHSLHSIWEVDVCYLPLVVQKSSEERPRFPRGFVLADHRTGVVLGWHTYDDPSEDAHQVINQLANYMVKLGLPKEIRVKSELMVAILEDLCCKTNIGLKRVTRLPRVARLLEELKTDFW